MYGSSVAVLKKADHVRPIIEKIVAERKYKSYEFKFTDDLAKGENFIGQIKRATLRGTRSNGERDVLNFIIKSAANSTVLSELFTRNEIFIYEAVHPYLKNLQNESEIPQDAMFKFVECYGTFSEAKKQTLLLKDLSFDGYTMYDRLITFDHGHLMMAVKELATFHALGFAALEKLPHEKLTEMRNNMISKKDHDDKFYSDLQRYGKNAVSIMDSLENKTAVEKMYSGTLEDMKLKYDAVTNFDKEYIPQYVTLCHGDFWINNLLFKYKDGKPQSMYLLDWQMVMIASPVIDISYLVYFCLDEGMRDKHWDEILGTYYDILKVRLKQLGYDAKNCYPEAKFRIQIPKVLEYGVMMSMMLLPLFMTNRADAKDAGELWENDVIDFSKLNYTDECKKRLNGIVRHYRTIGKI